MAKHDDRHPSSVAKQVLWVGIFFLIGGALSVVGGGLAMINFLRQPDIGRAMPASEILTGIVLPHIFVFLGVGVLTYGVILVGKVMIIERRRSHLPP